jgi:hypothetical protein
MPQHPANTDHTTWGGNGWVGGIELAMTVRTAARV